MVTFESEEPELAVQLEALPTPPQTNQLSFDLFSPLCLRIRHR